MPTEPADQLETPSGLPALPRMRMGHVALHTEQAHRPGCHEAVMSGRADRFHSRERLREASGGRFTCSSAHTVYLKTLDDTGYELERLGCRFVP